MTHHNLCAIIHCVENIILRSLGALSVASPCVHLFRRSRTKNSQSLFSPGDRILSSFCGCQTHSSLRLLHSPKCLSFLKFFTFFAFFHLLPLDFVFLSMPVRRFIFLELTVTSGCRYIILENFLFVNRFLEYFLTLCKIFKVSEGICLFPTK